MQIKPWNSLWDTVSICPFPLALLYTLSLTRPPCILFTSQKQPLPALKASPKAGQGRCSYTSYNTGLPLVTQDVTKGGGGGGGTQQRSVYKPHISKAGLTGLRKGGAAQLF
jgi:hypothetical protein